MLTVPVQECFWNSEESFGVEVDERDQLCRLLHYNFGDQKGCDGQVPSQREINARAQRMSE